MYPRNQFRGVDSARLWIDYRAGILKQSLGTRNRVGIGLSYRPARLNWLAEFIPWNWFLGSINVSKYRLCSTRTVRNLDLKNAFGRGKCPPPQVRKLSPYLLTFLEPKNRFLGSLKGLQIRGSCCSKKLAVLDVHCNCTIHVCKPRRNESKSNRSKTQKSHSLCLLSYTVNMYCIMFNILFC